MVVIAFIVSWPIDVYDVLFYMIVMLPELYLVGEYFMNDFTCTTIPEVDGLHYVKKGRELVLNSTTVKEIVLFESNARRGWFYLFPHQGYFFVGVQMKSGERLALTMALDPHIDEQLERATGRKLEVKNTEYATLAKWLVE